MIGIKCTCSEALTCPSFHICADDSDNGKDSCQGDSGGPLMIAENGRYLLKLCELIGRSIVKFRQGSGKDRLGMAPKGPSERP